MRRAFGLLCCVAVLISACGGNESSPTTTSAESPATTPAATVQETGVVAIEVPPCDLVTSEEVAAATGLNVGAGSDQPPISCVFLIGDDTGVDIYLNADDGEGRGIGPAAVFEAYKEMVAGGSGEAVTGLGEAAFYSQGFRTLVVDAGGGRFIAVGVNGGYQELDSPRDALVSIATTALGRL